MLIVFEVMHQIYVYNFMIFWKQDFLINILIYALVQFFVFLETYVHIFRHVREDTHKKSSYKNYVSKTYVHKFTFEIILL
jgi:hypothetical protein